MQGTLTACLGAIALFAGTPAAGAPTCTPSRIEVDVAPTLFDPPLAKLVSAQLSREAATCAPEATTQLIRIEVQWIDTNQASLHVEVRRGNKGRTGVRSVELSKVPRDGRALAMAIAATELIDEVSADWDGATAHPAPPPTPVTATPKPPVTRDDLAMVTPTVAFEWLTGGPVLIGPDAHVAFLTTSRIVGSVRFGVRATLSARAGATYVFGGGVGVSPWPLSARWGVLGKVRIDALSLPLPTASRETVVVPMIGMGAWFGVAPRARITTDLGVGAPVRTESRRAHGLVISLTAGIAVSF